MAVALVSRVHAGEAANENQQQVRLADQKSVNEEMQLINKSLEGLLSELAVIKREATGRLTQVKKLGLIPSGASGPSDSERVRQTKVSRFVLKRVAELETESLGMRDEMTKLFELQKKTSDASARSAAAPKLQVKQQDDEFDELPAKNGKPTSAATTTTSTTTSSTTTQAEQEQEAAQIGFDLEQLKRLGEEIGKRLDQFGKDAAKNLGELVEGIKLVFREPPKQRPKV